MSENNTTLSLKFIIIILSQAFMIQILFIYRSAYFVDELNVTLNGILIFAVLIKACFFTDFSDNAILQCVVSILKWLILSIFAFFISFNYVEKYNSKLILSSLY